MPREYRTLHRGIFRCMCIGNTAESMPANLIPVLIFGGIVLLMIVHTFKDIDRRKKLAAATIVRPGVEYPNNHHVLGVGYYHAAPGRWHVHPWNEFRESMGYYWDGEWHPEPDQRQVTASVPSLDEIHLTNHRWRMAGPDESVLFWRDVERNGFGTAIGRRQGS